MSRLVQLRKADGIMSRVQKAKQEADTEQVEEVEAAPVETPAADAAEDLLADIDDVLEENAEEFVQGFVQKGGQ